MVTKTCKSCGCTCDGLDEQIKKCIIEDVIGNAFKLPEPKRPLFNEGTGFVIIFLLIVSTFLLMANLAMLEKASEERKIEKTKDF